MLGESPSRVFRPKGVRQLRGRAGSRAVCFGTPPNERVAGGKRKGTAGNVRECEEVVVSSRRGHVSEHLVSKRVERHNSLRLCSDRSSLLRRDYRSTRTLRERGYYTGARDDYNGLRFDIDGFPKKQFQFLFTSQ